MNVCWVTGNGQSGVVEQTRVLADALDITRVSSHIANIEHEDSYIIDENGVVQPTKSLFRTLLDLSPDIVVFHSMNDRCREVIPKIQPFTTTVIRLGINLNAEMLVGHFKTVPQVLQNLKLADHIISSGSHPTSLLQAAGISMDKVSTIPSAIDTSQMQDPASDPPHTIGTIGRIDHAKNQFQTILAANGVRALDAEQPMVLLAGAKNGPEFDVIEASLHTLGLGRHIRYKGYVQNPMEDFYPELGVHVVPSWTENCPQTVLEAAVCGVPTIAPSANWVSDFSGIPTLKHDDPMQWSETIHTLLTDDEMRTELVRAQQQSIMQNDIQNIARQYKTVFDDLKRITKMKIDPEVRV